TERGFLELHHVVPFAAGGAATAENIQLRCRRHNAYEAEQRFGPGPLFVRERAEPGYGLQLGPDRVGAWRSRDAHQASFSRGHAPE
ncbi:MAG: HNH endonuclease, partial [Vicinamibacterales bacterium]